MDIPIHTDPDLFHALAPWMDQAWMLAGIPLVTPTPSLTMCTDASLTGWGATLGDHHAEGFWLGEQDSMHINVLELLAVLRAIEAFRDLLRSQVLLLLSDNTTCVAYLRKQGGTRSTVMSDLTWEILHLLQQLQVRMVVRHIPSSRNVLADALSRTKPLPTEWSLNRVVFSALQALLPDMTVDLFATRLNHRLDLFVSPCPDQRALAVDALSIPWDFQGIPYAFPPPRILPLVLRKIREERVPLLLMVAPFWPRQGWFPDLLELTVTHALRLPQSSSLLEQGKLRHPNPGLYALHAWPLSGLLTHAKVTRKPSLKKWLARVGTVLEPCMTASGVATRLGVTPRGSILSFPLVQD